MKESKSEIKKYYQLKRWEYSVLVGLVVIAFASPYIFTQFSIGPSFIGTGEIGDTIGGLTAPFINLAAAFLVYKSFTAQIQANIDQRNNHDAQMELIRKEQGINAISYLFNEVEKTITKNETQYNKCAVDYLNRMCDELKTVKENSGIQDYQKYVNRKKKQITPQISKVLDITSQNIKFLRVLSNHIEEYRNVFSKEKNTTELTYFFSTKINEIFIKFKYKDIAFGDLKDKLNNVNFEDEQDEFALNQLKEDITNLSKKLNEFSFTALFV
ncbi:MAG: hypothetical protein ABGX00_16310 [Allomuricauda sp.]